MRSRTAVVACLTLVAACGGNGQQPQAATTATRLSLLSAQRDEAVAAAALDFAFGAFDR